MEFLIGNFQPHTILIVVIAMLCVYYAYRYRKDDISDGWKNVTNSKDTLIAQYVNENKELRERLRLFNEVENRMIRVQTTIQNCVGPCGDDCILKKSVIDQMEKK